MRGDEGVDLGFDGGRLGVEGVSLQVQGDGIAVEKDDNDDGEEIYLVPLYWRV